MKELISLIQTHWLPVCVGLGVLLAVAGIGLVCIAISSKKRRNAPVEVPHPIQGIPLPQDTAHTLMTDATLELEDNTGNTAFAVEHDITYVHAEEVI